MSKKLTKITPSYHCFEPDQVLTDSQLNEFLEFFEDQHRLSRICLSGAGIVCGFEVKTLNNKIIITQGAGITTDGDLVNLEKTHADNDGTATVEFKEKAYTHFKVFIDDKAGYAPQFYETSGSTTTQIPLIELVAEGENTTEPPISGLDLSSKIVLLYVESYKDDPGACSTVSCDNQGAEQASNVRVLLVDRTDIKNLTDHDSLFSTYNVVSEYLSLEDVSVPRILLNPSNTRSLSNLALSYNKSLNHEGNVDSLVKGFTLMLTKVGLVNDRNIIVSYLNQLFDKTYWSTVKFQYRYDFLKDVVDSFDELKELFLTRYKECCPNITPFPKHLMLGSPLGDNSANQEFRHRFYPSPILNDKSEDADRFESVVKRVVQMVTSFSAYQSLTNDTVRITPSKFWAELGKRSVPYYYRFNTQLFEHWDFDRSKYGKFKKHLGYNAATFSKDLKVKEPFLYNSDAYNFFRIEGHIGLEHRAALSKVIEQKEKYSLPFDVKVLGITVDQSHQISLDDYACDFQDLSVLLKAWSEEQKCVLGHVTEVLSGFSTIKPGVNHNENDFLDFTVKPVKGTTLPGHTNNDKVTLVFGGDDYVNDNYLDSDKYSGAASHAAASYKPTADSKSGKVAKYLFGSKNSKKKNPVSDKLTVEKDTLGHYVHQAITHGGHVGSSGVQVVLDQYIGNLDVVNWEAGLAYATLAVPGKILAAAYAIAEIIPDEISQLDGDILAKYVEEVDKLCSYTRKLQTAYNKGHLTKVSKVTSTMVKLLNNQLSNVCCSAKKLEVLLKEIEERKAAILERIVFANFAQKHPGLEHHAGVKPGGTFVMVYVLKSHQASTKFIPDKFSDELFIRPEDGISIKSSSIPEGVVIADFALPYMFRSDCEPINFIVPTQKIYLTLPTDTVCLPEEGEVKTLEMAVSPLDGVIRTSKPVIGLTIVGTKLLIDPNKVAEDSFDKIIEFTVNDQYTNARLILRKAIQISFEVPDEPTSQTTFTFVPQGDIQAGHKYEWNFGDGSPVVRDQTPTHTYKLPLTSGNKATVTLTVTPANGSCPAVIRREIQFVGFQVSIDKTTFCENSKPYPFTIVPPGNPNIEGKGVTTDKKHFDPSVGPGNYPITLAGQPIATITVSPRPKLTEITWHEFEENMQFDSNAEFADTHQWMIFGGGEAILQYEGESPVVPLKNLAKLGRKTNVEFLVVKLRVTNGCGSAIHKKKMKVPHLEDPSVTIAKSYFCVEDKKDALFVVKGYSSDPEITGPGVSSNPPRFSPAAAGLGIHSISVNGVPSLSITVNGKPKVVTKMAETQTGITFKAGIANTISHNIVWRFTNKANGAELRPPISGSAAATVLFSEIQNEVWKELLATVTVSNKCGSTVQTITYKRRIEATIGLSPLEYCHKDTKHYPFEIKPQFATPSIAGPGVVGESKFSPSQAGVGNHQITVNGKLALTVVVLREPQGGILGSATPKKLHFAVGVHPDAGKVSIQWKIYRNLHLVDTREGQVYVDSTQAYGFKSGMTVTVEAIVTNICGSTTIRKKFPIHGDEINPNDGPGGGGGGIDVIVEAPDGDRPTRPEPGRTEGGDTVGCVNIVTKMLKADMNSLDALVEQNKAILTAGQNATVDEVKSFLGHFEKDTLGATTGSRNDQLPDHFEHLFTAVHKAIRTSKAANRHDRVQVLVDVYEILLKTFVGLIRCQSEESLGHAKILQVSSLLKSHFDAQKENSFRNMKVPMDQDSRLRNLIGQVLDDRDIATEPWYTLMFITQNIYQSM